MFSGRGHYLRENPVAATSPAAVVNPSPATRHRAQAERFSRLTAALRTAAFVAGVLGNATPGARERSRYYVIVETLDEHLRWLLNHSELGRTARRELEAAGGLKPPRLFDPSNLKAGEGEMGLR
jgi:hypothetical protein